MTVAIHEIGTASSALVLQSHPQPAAVEILTHARTTASGYAGDVTPEQAWSLFTNDIAKLIDVRTRQELQRVGQVPGAKNIEWLHGKDMQLNPRFLVELKKMAGKEDIILLLCRSGKRSVAAAQAVTKAGYRNVFNVLEGFEGDGNPACGWLNRNLPSADV